jgi:CRISPR type IV-associated protein Csf1
MGIEMITSPQLFAGTLNPTGEERCYYCSGVCGRDHSTNDYVKNTFTNRDIIKCPASQYICGGCLCTLNESATIDLADQEVLTGQKTRLYSWVFTKDKKTAYTKAHLKTITSILLNPPDPPFGVVLAVSSQKQLLFRSVVAWDRVNYPILLEDEVILVNPEELKDKLFLARGIVAAIGKPALGEMNLMHAIKYEAYYGNLDYFIQWKSERHKPLNRLVAFLTPA